MADKETLEFRFLRHGNRGYLRISSWTKLTVWTTVWTLEVWIVWTLEVSTVWTLEVWTVDFSRTWLALTLYSELDG